VPPFPTDSDKQGLAQRDLIYRLVAKNTIEEKIVALHHQKRDLADSLLEGTDMGGKISTDELLRLLQN
jgi:SNF2 family DNA or RNA helicase